MRLQLLLAIGKDYSSVYSMADKVAVCLEGAEDNEQKVTPWTAQAGKGKNSIDYDKLIGEFNNIL